MEERKKEMEKSFIGVLGALMHNGKLIRDAEEILQSAVKSENTYIYIENPNGTIIKLEKGFKIKDYEIVPMIVT